MIEDTTDIADLEARSDYKKTKIGWIPEDWKVHPLKNFIEKTYSGGTPSRDNLTFYLNGNISWIKSGELNQIYVKQTSEKITEEGLKNSSAKLVPPGTLLYALYGATAGLAGFTEIEAALNQAILAIFPKEKLKKKYLFYFLNHHKARILSKYTQGGQPNLSANLVKNLVIAAPCNEQQINIIKILSSWDAASEKLNQLIEQKELRKKGLMQQLLSGKKRLPGFSEEWTEKKFKKVAERVNRKNSEGNDNVVTISAQRGFVRQEDFFKKRVASKTLLNYTLVKNGEYCYNKSYSQGYPMGAFKRLNDFDKAVVTTLYICFSLKDTVNSDFMNHYFDAGKMIPGLMRVAQEGGRAHGLLNIGLEDFFNLKVKLPLLEEQKAIANVLTTSTQEIDLLKEKLEKLKNQKKGLMQVLLTGKKRLV